VRIRIALVARSNAWEQLCAQEGIPCAVIDLAAKSVAEECSLLVVNRVLGAEERNVVEHYLRNGGAVIGSTAHLQDVAGVEGTEQNQSYVVADHDSVFSSIHLLDVGVQGLTPRGANALRTDTGAFAVAAGPLGGGWAVVLPFDVDALYHDARPANKNFYSAPERLPSERVSLVGKGELRHLVCDAFVYLHQVRGLPYVHLWYFPKDLRSVFAFRIDTDGATREDIDTLYNLARESDTSLSWFLDVKSHEPWLDHFKYFVGQEIGLHCYEHQSYPMFDANLKNISKGIQGMRRSGLQPAGFTAPYGIWNPELAKAIDESGFEYSSEFSYAYDTLPLFAGAGGMVFHTLQVPIHPICIGSMLKVGYSDARMIEYFDRIIHLKLSRREPLFFYHHPTHRRWDVVRRIVSMPEQGVENVTLVEYARWWKRRIGVKYSSDISGSEIRIQHSAPSVPDDVWIRIVNPNGEEVILPSKEIIDLRSIATWRKPERQVPPPEDIRRIREFDPRQMVGHLFNTLVRKFR
jgi:hypothetical protein